MDLWKRFIAKHVKRIIFVADWQFSIGCATEFEKALEHGIPTESISGAIITREDGLALLAAARDDLVSNDADGNTRGRLQSMQLRDLLGPIYSAA